MTTKTAALFAALLLGPVFAFPSDGSAQEPRPLAQPDAVPIDLASALLAAGGFGGEPQILVGSMPEWAMSKLALSSDDHLLGSAFLGTTVVAVVRVSQPPVAAIAAARIALLAHGWTNPPPQPVPGGGGFRSLPVTVTQNSAASTRVTMCSDQQMLTASGATQHGSVTIVTYHLGASAGYSTCRPPDLNPGLMARSLLPTLYNPAGSADGASMVACLTGQVSGSSGTSGTLASPLSSDALLDHYGAQLADSGWKAEGANGAVVGRTWMRPDSAGNIIETSISIRTLGQNPRCREARMDVRTTRKP